ncbi:type VI secretion system contractile sheath small subunit [Jannaschia pohangensis]|uniref:Type VI secretion system protein ImpB n=1 Tax=Jannaschia pohangensis TaxID=390807 RepID=A0A1I3UJC4_9RHOB|nr:type VI secretion system contractile sheath small subunit [Jannaschia pohangensis]SFJ83618.1 type VI secretion system protein ImpB [Jannaschia pohangensis]
MAADKGTDFIKRNRPPRVQISYQDPYDSTKMVELPFVMGVLSDLSGNASLVEKPAVEEREFSDVTKDTLDDFVESIQPGVSMNVNNRLDPDSGTKMGVSLHFNSMDDFEPAAIAAQVPALKKLLEARQQLANLQRYMSSKPKAQEHVKRLLADPALMAALAERAPDTDDDKDNDA